MKKQPNRWLVFSSLAFQIGIIMYASIQLGNFLDEKFSTTSFALISSVWACHGIMAYLQTKQKILE